LKDVAEGQRNMKFIKKYKNIKKGISILQYIKEISYMCVRFGGHVNIQISYKIL
jgi:hypothetical protein